MKLTKHQREVVRRMQQGQNLTGYDSGLSYTRVLQDDAGRAAALPVSGITINRLEAAGAIERGPVYRAPGRYVYKLTGAGRLG